MRNPVCFHRHARLTAALVVASFVLLLSGSVALATGGATESTALSDLTGAFYQISYDTASALSNGYQGKVDMTFGSNGYQISDIKVHITYDSERFYAPSIDTSSTTYHSWASATTYEVSTATAGVVTFHVAFTATTFTDEKLFGLSFTSRCINDGGIDTLVMPYGDANAVVCSGTSYGIASLSDGHIMIPV